MNDESETPRDEKGAVLGIVFAVGVLVGALLAALPVP